MDRGTGAPCSPCGTALSFQAIQNRRPGAPRQRPTCAANVAAGRAREGSKLCPKPTILENPDESIATKDTFTEEGRERIWQQRWDLVIIDEAHKCSARTASGGENREPKVVTTKRYDLAWRLTSQADHVLLLTATPHHGDEDKFAHFLRLIDPAKLKEYEEATGIALAHSHVDFSAFQRRNLEVEERRLMPRYVEAQFVAAAREVGLRIEPRADGLWRVEHVLADLRSERLRCVQKVGKAESSYRKITFHKHHLEEDAHRPSFEVIPSDILLNLAAYPHPPQKIEPTPTQAAADFLKATYQLECRGRCQMERQHFARVCREYLEKSFKARIDRAQERAMLLAAEAVSRPEFKLAADEARKYVDELQRARRERLDGLKQLEIARTGPVKHVGTAFVLAPDADIQAQLADLTDELDPNIRRQSEIAAEDKVIEALVAEGFSQDRSERVGHLKLGFDIRAHRIADEATGEVFVKRIEVKGRLRGQPVRLTTNEWYKAQQLAETYWLYVVWDPLGDSPELVRIQNPVAKLDHAKREIVAARFYEIPAEAIHATNEQRHEK